VWNCYFFDVWSIHNVCSNFCCILFFFVFFFQAEDGIRDGHVTGVQTCALPILCWMLPMFGTLSRRTSPNTSYPFFRRSSIKYEPSWPVAPVTRADFTIGLEVRHRPLTISPFPSGFAPNGDAGRRTRASSRGTRTRRMMEPARWKPPSSTEGSRYRVLGARTCGEHRGGDDPFRSDCEREPVLFEPHADRPLLRVPQGDGGYRSPLHGVFSVAAEALKGRSPRESIHRHRFDRDAVVAEPPTDRRVVHSPVRMPHPSFLERSSETGICVEARAHRGRRELGKGWTLSCGGPGRRGVPNRDEPPA